MPLSPGGSALTHTLLLAPVSINTTTTSAQIDISTYEGDLVFIQQIGVVTSGTVASKVQSATASGGTYGDVTGGGFTAVTTANDPLTEAVVVKQNACNAWVQVLSTVTTGAMLASLSLAGTKKYRA